MRRDSQSFYVSFYAEIHYEISNKIPGSDDRDCGCGGYNNHNADNKDCSIAAGKPILY